MQLARGPGEAATTGDLVELGLGPRTAEWRLSGAEGTTVHHDIRLIAVDMDGSLLDDEKRIHDDFWPLLDELARRDILLCPASGRQYATLRRQVGRDELVYIAENGSYVVQHDEEISSDGLDLSTARVVVELVRAATDLDLGTVVCGKRSAYVERSDDVFLEQAVPYYAKLEVVADLLAVDDDVLKVAVYDFGSAATGAGPKS